MSDSGSSTAASPAPAQLQQQQQQQDSAAAPPPGADEQPLEDDSLETSFFPAPAPYYTRYTSDNLALPLAAPVQLPNGQEVSRAELEPPNIDWIVEEGSYSVFGETWPVEEKLPSLAEMGVQELFDPTVGEF
jgi:mediator of RNA polymerase II transcription subunit 7